MATVSELEMEQKTAEYTHYVKDHMIATNKRYYKSASMYLHMDRNNRITLEFEGKE